MAKKNIEEEMENSELALEGLLTKIFSANFL